MNRAWIIAAAFVLLVSAYAFGRVEGARIEQAAMSARIADALQRAAHNAELLSRKEQQRLAAESDRAAIAQDLEDQANAQNAAGVCLPYDRVRRLQLR